MPKAARALRAYESSMRASIGTAIFSMFSESHNCSCEIVWQQLFRDAGRTDAELSSIRRVVMSAARGFGVLKMLQPHGLNEPDRRTLYHIALRELRNGRP